MQDNHHPTRRVTYGHIMILKLKLLIKYRIINHLEESHSISLRIRQDPNQFYFHHLEIENFEKYHVVPKMAHLSHIENFRFTFGVSSMHRDLLPL